MARRRGKISNRWAARCRDASCNYFRSFGRLDKNKNLAAYNLIFFMSFPLPLPPERIRRESSGKGIDKCLDVPRLVRQMQIPKGCFLIDSGNLPVYYLDIQYRDMPLLLCNAWEDPESISLKRRLVAAKDFWFSFLLRGQ